MNKLSTTTTVSIILKGIGHHLTKMESLALLLRCNRDIEWLVLDKADCLLDGWAAALGGRWSRFSSGCAGAVAWGGAGLPGLSGVC